MIGFWIVALIAGLHVYILVLEMFLWESALALRSFGTTPVFAANTKVMAANQGLYNGFLAAGLLWALLKGLPGAGQEVAVFFLACVMVAGIYGGQTASRRILYVQALPAALGLVAVLAGV
jgi:putative membrane protein